MKLCLVVIFASLPNAYAGAAFGLRYATSGFGTNSCPAGTTAATQAQCDAMAAAIVPSPTTADQKYAKADLLSLFRAAQGDATYNFGAVHGLGQTSLTGTDLVAASYAPIGCYMVKGGSSTSNYNGAMKYNSHSSGASFNDNMPVCMQNVWIAGDPHISFAHGGKADLRGEHGKYFVMHSAPNASLAMQTTHTHFKQKMGKQTVHGSHFTAATAVLRTNTTGQLVSITVDAAVTPWFAPYAAVVVSGAAQGTKPLKVAFGGDKSKTVPSFAIEDVVVNATSRTKLTIAGAGWEYALVRRILFKPLFGSKSHYLNVGITPVAADPTRAHGVLGQSFSFGKKVDGKLDDYTGDEVTTSAQAEGAIEGVYTDYKVDNPFNTTFKYSRFDAPATTSPRLAAVGGVPLSAGADDTPVEEA